MSSFVQMKSADVRKLAENCVSRIHLMRERRKQKAIDALRAQYIKRYSSWFHRLFGVKVPRDLPTDEELG